MKCEVCSKKKLVIMKCIGCNKQLCVKDMADHECVREDSSKMPEKIVPEKLKEKI